MKEAQNKIKKIVEDYKKFLPDEYKLCCEAVELVRRHTDNEVGELNKKYKGTVIQRKLGEYPEAIANMSFQKLDSDELRWFKSIEGQRWFFREYKEFSTAKI